MVQFSLSMPLALGINCQSLQRTRLALSPTPPCRLQDSAEQVLVEHDADQAAQLTVVSCQARGAPSPMIGL